MYSNKADLCTSSVAIQQAILTSAGVAGPFAIKLLQHICKVVIFTECAAPCIAVVMGVDASHSWKQSDRKRTAKDGDKQNR